MDRDAIELQRLGYAQVLARGLGAFTSFALSFSVLSVPTGALTLYRHGLRNGGPLQMALGWPLVSLLSLAVALSLAELASSCPTAGALYHWASRLGGRGAGWATGWLNLLGQIAVTAGVDYGLGEFCAGLLGLEGRRWPILLCAGFVLLHAALTHRGVRLVARLNGLSAWVHVAGVAFIVGALWAFAPLRPPSFLLQRFQAQPGSFAALFALGLLQSCWTFTGYDAASHVSEETRDAARTAPRAIVLSVAISGVVGFVLLAAVTLAIQDLPAAAEAANPFLFIARTALGGRLGTAVVLTAMAAMWFCGLASLTSSSRLLFAFARDGGLPAALARVSARSASPVAAVWTSGAAAVAVVLWADAYEAVTALGTVALYASYGVPIACALLLRGRGKAVARGPWHLGRWSRAINTVALVFIAGACVLLSLPPNGLSGATFAAVLLALWTAWRLRLADRFAGPPARAVPALSPDGPPAQDPP